MGVVFKARHAQLDRLVAIKMILAGACASDDATRRFQAEAESVARLQHPHIVQIHDMGEHEGQQYLVLEHLDGGSLAHRISGKPQAARLAAEIVALLSRTVGYAHRKGIVHRDLKPANVLLGSANTDVETVDVNDTRDGILDLRTVVLKITDFGLAKRLDGSQEQTHTGAVMGTPSYMAPEQASGQVRDAGPAIDVYALGAILYELMTGRPPFLGETAMATLDQVMRQEPVPPTRLQPRVPRDLETICLKCLDKDPARRYATADDLADDLGRFLNHEPIRARRTSPVVRALRWARRRPSAAALVVVSAVALFTLLAGSSWYGAVVRSERNKAEENFRLALAAVDGMLTEVGQQQLAYEPRMERKRRALLQKALALYQKFLKQKADDKRLRLETAHAFRRMGDIERWLGNHRQAATAYQSAIQLIVQLRTNEPQNAEYRRWLGYCYNYLGEVQRQSSMTGQAEESYVQAMRLQRQLHDELPSVVVYVQDLARSYYNAGILFRETNRLADAENSLVQAVKLLRDLVSGKNTGDATSKQDLARAYINLGPVLRATRRYPDAIDRYSKAIGLLEELAEQFMDHPEYRLELAVACSNRGNCHLTIGKKNEARQDYDRACDLLRQLVRDHPSAPVPRQELANTCNSLAAMQSSIEGIEAAERTWTEAAELLRELVAEHSSMPVYHGDLGMTLGNLGWALARQKKFESARQRLQEGIGHLETALRANAEQPDYLLSLRTQLQELAEAFLELGDHAAAAATAQRIGDHRAGSPSDAVVAAGMLVRSAELAEHDAQSTPNTRAEIIHRYDARAVELLHRAVREGFSDSQLLEQTRAVMADRLNRNPALGEVYSQLEAQVASSQKP
jgi:tetratricopeptide (TPR) repeat protein